MISVDINTCWPEALLLPNPTADKVVEFMSEDIARHGIPERERTDRGKVFKSEKFRQFCKKTNQPSVYPIREQRGNGKVERLIRTIHEILRTDKKLFYLRTMWDCPKFCLHYDRKKEEMGDLHLNHTNHDPNTPKIAMLSNCRQKPKTENNSEGKNSWLKVGKDIHKNGIKNHRGVTTHDNHAARNWQACHCVKNGCGNKEQDENV